MTNTFTPEQISQILEEFFKVVGTRQYIGARYVPIFGRKGEESIEWDNSAPYEPLTIVLHQGNSYTSRQYVPIGVEITNEEFWAPTGNYNAQVEIYRREVVAAKTTADEAKITADNAQIAANNAQTAADNAQRDIDAVNSLIPSSDFSDVNTVKDYIDAVTIQKVLSFNNDVDFYPYTRCVWENNGTFKNSQAACITNDENTIFFVRPFSDSDQTTTKQSNLTAVDARSGEIISNTVVDVGHGRTLSLKNNLLLTSNQYAMTDNEWICIDVSNSAHPVTVSRGTFYGRHIFWTDDGAACYDSSNNSIRFFDVTYNNNIPVDFTYKSSIQIAASTRGEEQSFQYYNGIIVIASTLPEMITFVDATNGNIINTITLRGNYSYMHTAECESAFIVNDHLYFTNNSYLPNTADGVVLNEMGVFRCDLLSQKSEYYDPWVNMHLQNRSATVYVSGVKNNESSVTANGSSAYPYRFVADSMVGFTKERFLNPNGNGFTLLSINFTTDNYPYCIIINNSPFYVVFNGVTEKTKTGCIAVSNSVASINRLQITANIMSRFGTGDTTAVGICSISNAFVRVLNTTFEYNGTLTEYDIVARNSGMIQVETSSVVNSARTSSGFILYDNKIGIAKTSINHGFIYNNYFPLLNSVTGLNFGVNDSNNNAWISLMKNDGSMVRLFIDADAGIYYRNYPNVDDLSTYTTLGHVAWSN